MVDKRLFHWRALHDKKHPLAKYPISDMKLKKVKLFTTNSVVGDIMKAFKRG